jgi:hypothetical protein
MGLTDAHRHRFSYRRPLPDRRVSDVWDSDSRQASVPPFTPGRTHGGDR